MLERSELWAGPRPRMLATVTTSEGDQQPRLTVAAVAKRLGVAPATLRTWDRRYDLGPSDRVDGTHRLYNPADLARLERMRRLVLDGVSPGEAARIARDEPSDDRPAPTASGFPDLSGRLEARASTPPRPVPGSDELVRGLVRAASSLDSEAVSTTVRQQLAEHGVISAWNNVLLPVLVIVGARWAASGEGVEVEHLLSDCVNGALRQHALHHAPVAPPRPVLLACAPGDLHVLPLHALAAGLAERGTASRVLGADVPAHGLAAAVRRTGPAALFVWSQTAASGDPATLAQLPITRPPTAMVAGGPGWDLDRLPDHVTVVDDLGVALALVGQALQTAQ